MDGVSTAGGVVSLVAVAGQLAQATKKLYDFWSSVKDIPESLQWLTEDLRLVGQIIDHIQRQSSPNSSAVRDIQCQALQRCTSYIKILEALVAPWVPAAGGRNNETLWRSIKATFKSDKIKNYKTNLEAAKTSLILDQNAWYQDMITTVHDEDRRRILALQSGVETIFTAQNSSFTNVISHYERLDGRITSCQQDIRRIASATAMNVKDPSAPFITPLVEKTVSSVLEKSIGEYLSKLKVEKSSQRKVSRDHFKRRERKVASNDSITAAKAVLASRGGNYRISKSRREISIFRKSYKTPLGLITVQCGKCTSNRDEEFSNEICHVDDDVLELRLAFVPRPWLFRRASFLTGSWELPPKNSLKAINLDFRPVVDSESAIFKACRAGDIDSMKMLFQARLASPYDINEDGDGLLLVSHPISRRVPIPSDINQHAIAGPYSKRVETCKFLLNLAGEALESTAQGSCSLFCQMCSWLTLGQLEILLKYSRSAVSDFPKIP